MVERPIKKSERQANAAPGNVEEVLADELNSSEGSLDATSQASKERSTTPPLPRKDKTERKGKSNQQQNERLPVNPAFVRGPKPKKLQPPVIKSSQEESAEDAQGEPSQQETTED